MNPLGSIEISGTDSGAVVQIGDTATLTGVLFEDDANVILGPSPIIWIRGHDVSVISPPAWTSEVFGIVPWILGHNLYAVVFGPSSSPDGQELSGAVYRYEDRGWHKLYDLPLPCDFSHATVHDGVVYFSGGGRCGVLRLDDGNLGDVGNLNHSSGVIFFG